MRTGRAMPLAVGAGVLLAGVLAAAVGFDLRQTALIVGALVAVWAVLLSIWR